MSDPVRAYPVTPGSNDAERPTRARVLLQLVRFGLTGLLVFIVYTGGTLLLSGPLGVPIVLAIGIATLLALILNFTMQRHFVFHDHDTFALGLRAQFGRYVLAVLINYAVTALIVSTVPGATGLSQELVFVLTAMVMSLVSFTVVRGWIFHLPSHDA
jgi:putative flippase GtrA